MMQEKIEKGTRMTDKEIAERLRDMSNRIGSLTQSSFAELADELDPPRPEPGTVVQNRIAMLVEE